MKHLAFISALLFLPGLASSQDTLNEETAASNATRYIYDNDLLNKDFHKGRREALRNRMPDKSVAVFFAAATRNISNDIDYEYHQSPDFYYLTGLREPHSMLLLFKEVQDFDSVITNEIIFVQPHDKAHEMWDGRRMGIKGVKEVLGFDAVFENKFFADFRIDFSEYEQILSIPPHDDVRDNKRNRGDLYSLIKHFRIKTDTLSNRNDRQKIQDIMSALRQVKQPEELTLMINAIEYTCEAQKELMKALMPEMTEYQAEAIVEYIFKKNGAEQPAFPSVLGGGENSCILHNTTNRKKLLEEELLVCDIGAEYHGYNADITRTIPVDGTFSEEQTIIYSIVLEAQLAGIAACRSGKKFWDPNVAARAVIKRRLKEHGIIKDSYELNKYFMHGTSHYLGLDVHDVGLYNTLKQGNIITVEPGIYIPEGSDCDRKWWNIGVRIEDDILITDGEPEILSSCVPKTIKEIEELMKEVSIFNSLGK